MSQGFCFDLVSVCEWHSVFLGSDMSAYMVVAKIIHHGLY